MEPDQVHISEDEAYGMARSVAFNSLAKVIVDEDVDVGSRIWAAEIVLDHRHKEEKKS